MFNIQFIYYQLLGTLPFIYFFNVYFTKHQLLVQYINQKVEVEKFRIIKGQSYQPRGWGWEVQDQLGFDKPKNLGLVVEH